MLTSLRYNFRNPTRWARPSADLYNRIIDQIAWADAAGFDRVTFAEHHFLEEVFLPALLPICAAVAARTRRLPPRRSTFLHVSEDPERDWALIRPHALFELEQYRHWGMTGAASYGDMQTSETTLREIHAVWTLDATRDYVVEQQARFPQSTFSFAPLLAGMDPELAQSSLDLFAAKVLPALNAARCAA